MIRKITLTGIMLAFVLCSFAKEYKKDALAYLQKNQTEIKLTSQDIAGLTVLTDYYDEFSQINRVWFQQNLNGIPLKNAQIGMHFKDGKLVHYTNSGVYDLKKQVQSLTPVISASEAVVKAASFVGINGISSSNIQLMQEVDKKQNLYIFKPVTGLTNLEIHVQLILARNKENKVFLSWVTQFHSLDENNFWNIDVNAINGSLVSKYDQVLHCEFGTGKFLESQSSSHNHMYEGTPSIPQGANQDVSGPETGAYRVYPYTVESPIFGSRQLISNPDDAVASPFGWHDTNGAAGAEYTTTRGNNVNAYADKDANNAADAGSAPDGGASLNFDFPLDFNSQLDTLVNSKAIVTQLFYMNNIMHDIFTKYGFTESSRNFQSKNYSGVTGGNDFVWAEAHDGSGNNNANFATSPDGVNTAFSRSRMQMFMWDGAPPVQLTYNAPASIAGDIDSIGVQSGWGPCNFNVTGAVANATSATLPASFVCGSVNNASEINGKIALIDRGNCDFSSKVYNAQLAGAIGVIIINRQSAGDSLLNMSGGANAGLVTIPAVIVKYTDGQKLRNNLATANVTLFRQSSTNCLELDGSLDNGIVSHEYGHGISTRLTGLTSGTGGTSSCLSNEEQAGEGWSDFFALVLSKKATDDKNTARGIGNYAVAQDVNGGGIRRFPYSYDMTINPLTYADLADDPEVHAIGEVWTAAVWDMYWILVEKYGYSNDLYNGTLGNNRAIKLVIEGLKLQGCNPGFLDSRNAILKADSILYGYADRCEIWSAFARRGMGFSALQGSAGSATDQTAAFNLHPLCNTSPTATASFTASDTVVCVGSTLTFTNTSIASVGSPDSVRWTINGGTPSTSTSTTTVTPTFNTVGTYTISLVAYKSGNASTAATKSIRVRPNAAISFTSAVGTNAQIKCVNTAITNITYSVTGGGTGAGVTGLPTGVTGSFAGGVFTISGTPSVTGTFNYTVTTTGTCIQATQTGTITVTPNAAISLTSTAGTNTQSKCVNTAITNITYSVTGGGTGAGVTGLPTGVTGSFAGGVFTISGTPSVTGTFNYTVTTTGTCTQATATGTITVTPNASISLTSAVGTNTQSKCVNAAITNITYSVTGGGTGASATGLPTGVTGSFAGGVFTISGTPSVTGTFNYTVTTTGTCIQATATGTITVNATPNVTVTSPTGICAGQTAQPVANGADSYSWTGGLASVSNPTTPALNATTTYTVTGTSNGCTATAVSTVTVTPLPNVTVTSPSICSGSTATIQASGAVDGYTWTGGLSGNPATTPVLNTTTTYTVTGTTNGCSNTAVSTVTVNSSAPTVTITSNPVGASVCNGDAITLTANGANSYTWTSTQTGTTTGGTLNFIPTSNLTVNLSGTVTGCTTPGTTSVNVTIKSKPSVGVSSPSICTGETAQPVAGGADSYTWTGGLASVGSPTTPALTTTTTYTVTGTTNGCSNTAVSVVTVNARPNITASSASICSGQTAQLQANGGTDYTWTGGLAAVSNPTTPALTATTSYTVTGTNGTCTNTAVSTVTVTAVPSTPSITQSNDTLFSSTIVVGGSYKWYLAGGLVATTTDPFYKFTTQGSYTLTVTKGDCESTLSAAFQTSPTTGVKNKTNSVKMFEVYPNPTSGLLNVSLTLYKNSSVNISVYTPEGREVYVKSYGTVKVLTDAINMNELSQGVYIIKLRVDEEVYYHKVVKN